MRDWIDHLSFRARALIIIVVFMVTMAAMIDNSAQLLAQLGQAVIESAVSASWAVKVGVLQLKKECDDIVTSGENRDRHQHNNDKSIFFAHRIFLRIRW